MIPISIDKFIRKYIKINGNKNEKEIRKRLEEFVMRKKEGATCIICGQPIWAIGSSVVGFQGCFTCITGEANDSEDYEIDEVYGEITARKASKERRQGMGPYFKDRRCWYCGRKTTQQFLDLFHCKCGKSYIKKGYGRWEAFDRTGDMVFCLYRTKKGKKKAMIRYRTKQTEGGDLHETMGRCKEKYPLS